jgi:hypothetical protein
MLPGNFVSPDSGRDVVDVAVADEPKLEIADSTVKLLRFIK